MATANLTAEPHSPSQFSSEELAQFHEQGFAIVRQVADSDTIRRMLEVTHYGVTHRVPPLELEAELQYPGAPAAVNEEGGETVRRLKQAASRDFAFMQWLVHPGILQRLKQILGEKVVCPLAHHNCIMTKEPRFSSDTGWHQDIRYWSFTRPDLVSVWLALGPERRENGCLQLIPGSHRQNYPRSSFDDALFFRSDLPENQPILDQRIYAELNPGDVLFFHARTLHAATRNFSQQTKYSVVFTFRSYDNPPLPGTRSSASPELLLH
jgi:phytanoyl-CoA hydroxylase